MRLRCEFTESFCGGGGLGSDRDALLKETLEDWAVDGDGSLNVV